jgi:uracil-DNA glycosylase
MKIQQLFDELKTQTENKESVFAESGMVNCYDKMQYGFFPLGLGILTENNKIKDGIPTDEIAEGGVMVLGNDFGTLSYVENDCNDVGEIDGKTVNNLIGKAMLSVNNTFFTNFYLGVRRVDGLYKGTTMTKRIFDGKPNKLRDCYKQLSYNFFITQLELVKPRIVICLGHDVKDALIETCRVAQWKKSDSLKNIYAKKKYSGVIEKLGNITFVIIPHPCDLRNFRSEHIEKLTEELNNNSNLKLLDLTTL